MVRADAFAGIPSVTILPPTTELHDALLVRITVPPAADNGPRATWQVMIDKAITIPRVRVGQVIGRASGDTLRDVDLALSRFLGLS